MAEIWQVNPANPDAAVIARAAEKICGGHVVAIPTDTFYGLAANPFDMAAVEEVFALKGRPKDAPLLLLVDSVEMALDLAASVPDCFHRLARMFWPGPLTIVVEAARKVPDTVTAGTGRVGLRWPDAAVAVALVERVGHALTGTSANRSGERECSTAGEVAQRLGSLLPLILDGGPAPPDARPSTVLDVRGDSWKILGKGRFLDPKSPPPSELVMIKNFQQPKVWC